MQWRPVSIADATAVGKVAPAPSGTTDVAQQSVNADADGAYSISGLDPLGLYEVVFSKPGHDDVNRIVQMPGGPTALDVSMVPGQGVVTGIITDPSGTPLGGAQVTLSDGAVFYNATTPSTGEDAGRFAFANLATPKTYILEARATGRGLASQTFDLAAKGSASNIALVLSPDVTDLVGSVTSMAFEAETGVQAQSDDGGVATTTRVPAVSIVATEGNLSRSTTSLTEGNQAGTFSIPQLPVGRTYPVTYSAPGFTPLTEQIELSVDTPRREISIRRSTGRLRGTVTVTGTNLSPTAVAVTVTNPDFTYKSTDAISSDGSLLVDGIEPGHYVVVFNALGLQDRVIEVDIGAGTSTIVDVTVPASTVSQTRATLQYKVIKAGQPNSNPVSATLLYRSSTECGLVGSDSDCVYAPDADSKVIVTDLEAGGYAVRFSAEGYADNTVTTTIAAGQTAELVEVLLIPLGSIVGQVTDDTGNPVQGVQLTLKLDGVAVGDPVVSDAKGEYRFDKRLRAKTYTVGISASGFEPLERTVFGTLGIVQNLDLAVRGKSLATGEVRSLDLTTGNYVAAEPANFALYLKSGSSWVDGTTVGVVETLGSYRLALEPLAAGAAPYVICAILVTTTGTAITPNASTACDAASQVPGTSMPNGVTARIATVTSLQLGETTNNSFYFSPSPGRISGSVTVGGALEAGIKIEARRVDENGKILESLTTVSLADLVSTPTVNELGTFSFGAITPVRPTPSNGQVPANERLNCTFTNGTCWVVRASKDGTGFADSAQLTVYPGDLVAISPAINIVRAGAKYNATFTNDIGTKLSGIVAVVYKATSGDPIPSTGWDGTCGSLTLPSGAQCLVSDVNGLASFAGLDPGDWKMSVKFAGTDPDYRDLAVDFTATQAGVIDQTQKLVARKGSILVDVRDGSGTPVGGAVATLSANQTCTTNTADNTPVNLLKAGTCQITGVLAGVQTLTITKATFAAATAVVTVVGGQTAGAAAVLGASAGSLRVTARSLLGDALTDATVAVKS
ncbi:MAG: carboxypeptidase regulatory-like domain-containing protein, partial [Ilumatobacteraceae bacterium]